MAVITAFDHGRLFPVVSCCIHIRAIEFRKVKNFPCVAEILLELIGCANAEDIDYINVHGTSTPVGDIGEVKAIVKLFGEHAYKLNISSTKSMTGHLLGATGAMEAVLSVKTITDGIVPPTINHEEGDEDEEIDYNLNFTFNKAQKREVRAALSNSFGFGGHNASIIVKKFEK